MSGLTVEEVARHMAKKVIMISSEVPVAATKLRRPVLA